MEVNGVNIFRLGNSFKLKNGITIYIDPYAVYDDDKADIILISHDHADSCSAIDVEKLVKDDTVIITTATCADKLQRDVKIVNSGDEVEVYGVKIKCVPAYNNHPDKRFHIKGSCLGFKLMLGHSIFYYAGHTDFIHEMRELGRVDVAILPVGNPEVMDVEDCAEAMHAIKALYTIPFYYSGDEGHSLREHSTNSKVILL